MRNKEKLTRKEKAIEEVKEIKRKIDKEIEKGITFREIALLALIILRIEGKKANVSDFLDAVRLFNIFDSEEQKEKGIKSEYKMITDFFNVIIEALEEDEK